LSRWKNPPTFRPKEEIDQIFQILQDHFNNTSNPAELIQTLLRENKEMKNQLRNVQSENETIKINFKMLTMKKETKKRNYEMLKVKKEDKYFYKIFHDKSLSLLASICILSHI
jgi:predicted transcriptional regulator